MSPATRREYEMNNRAKVVVGASVGLLAIWLILRVVMLSQAGVSGAGIFYLGLPIGGIVALLLLLMRLGLLNFGERSSATVQHWQPDSAMQGPRPVSPPSQRLQELEALRTSGAISDTEYAEQRAGIISGI
jgi:hypothetical protein